MGLLVALGTSAAYGYSLISMGLAAATASGDMHSYDGHVYFEASGIIITFVCAGGRGTVGGGLWEGDCGRRTVGLGLGVGVGAAGLARCNAACRAAPRG